MIGGRQGVTGLAVVVLCMTALWVGPARAQDGQALADRLDRLERDIQAVTRMVARGGTGSLPATVSGTQESAPILETGPAAARLSVHVQSVERDMQTLTGRVEEFTFRLDQLDKRLEKLTTDMEYRLSTLEQRRSGVSPRAPQTGAMTPARSGTLTAADLVPSSALTPAPSAPAAQPGVLGTINQSDLDALKKVTQTMPQSTEQAAATAPQSAAASLPQGSPQDQYSYAFDLLRKTEYAQAEQALTAFIDKYGTTKEPLLGNAYYWLGETYYVRSDFVSAARTFLEGYQKHPLGSKAPDTLLKLGMALANLGKPKEACATFGKLLEEQTKASASLRGRAESEQRRTGCP
ncbi:tol-pal system protein YbgF [Magnetospira thiophila]